MSAVKLILSVTAVLAAIYFFHYFAEELLEVKTVLGYYKGKVLEMHLGTKIAVFKGIPFAKYSDRFGDPEPFGEIHTGLYYASRDMEVCMQETTGLSSKLDTSETCLHINIWVPQPERKGREVMVWIHGGKYEFGSGSAPEYDGSVLATHGDVIVVSFNYRLGIFGFYYSGIPGYNVGNMGIKDQQMALKWVHKHIGSFGGDPNKVTIFGESAGASSVALHLALPGSKGLFQRAIMQSVPSLYEGYNTPETMDEGSQKLFEYFNCQEKNVVTCMRNLSAEKLLKGSSELGLIWLPVVDGKFLSDIPTNLIRRANLDGVDVLIGVNGNEGAMFVDRLPGVSGGKVQKDPKKVFEDVCKMQASRVPSSKSPETICKSYTPQNPGSPEQVVKALGDVFGDRHFVCATDRLVQLLEQQNAKVHLYHLTQREKHSRYPEHWGVPHTADLQWVFGAPFSSREHTKYERDEEEFSKIVMDMWIQFAKYGDPVIQSDLEWDPYTMDYPVYLELKLPKCFLHRGEAIRENYCSLWF